MGVFKEKRCKKASTIFLHFFQKWIFKSDLLYMKNSILCKIGNWGPLILFGTSVYLLSDKGNMLYYYIVGLILNTIFNVFLKVSMTRISS